MHARGGGAAEGAGDGGRVDAGTEHVEVNVVAAVEESREGLRELLDAFPRQPRAGKQ